MSDKIYPRGSSFTKDTSWINKLVETSMKGESVHMEHKWTRLASEYDVVQKVKDILSNGGNSIKIERSQCQSGWWDIYWYD